MKHLRRRSLAFCVAGALAGAAPIALAGTVSNCNDTGPGSLRLAIAAAASGETITFDTVAMNCSTITLTSGELQVDVQTLTLQGPASQTITIDGNNDGRVIHDGVTAGSLDRTRKITIDHLRIANGSYTGAGSVGAFFGGCIDADGDVTLVDATVTGCSISNTLGSAAGGGVASHTLHAHGSTISASAAHAAYVQPGVLTGSEGGGAYVSGSVVLDNSVISGNTADNDSSGLSDGGGLFVQMAPGDQLDISGSTISNNAARYGGGLFFSAGPNAANATIARSTISANSARFAAGADFYGANANVTLTNATVSGNNAAYGAAGIVSYVANNRFLHATIAFNTATKQTFIGKFVSGTFAGGVNAANLTLENTIIGKNTANGGGSDLQSLGFSVGGSHDLIMTLLGATFVPGDTLTGDPSLAGLANNGGPTLTHALEAASPAIDAGTSCVASPPNSDQRGPGYPRIWGAKPDIGALEFGPATGDVIFRGVFDGEVCAI